MCLTDIDDVNECAVNNGNCSEFANCMKVPGTVYTCTCMTGYFGDGFDCTGLFFYFCDKSVNKKNNLTENKEVSK